MRYVLGALSRNFGKWVFSSGFRGQVKSRLRLLVSGFILITNNCHVLSLPFLLEKMPRRLLNFSTF